jgi:hypothetical protein
MSGLLEITAVAAHRPAANAPAEAVAAWYDSVGLMHEHLAADAAEHRRDQEAATESALAARAHDRARRILTGAVA